MSAAFEFWAYLLTFAVIIRGLCWLTTSFQERWSDIRSAVREHWRGTVGVIWIVVVLIFCLPVLLNDVRDISTSGWKFWLQTFAGNWSPDSFPVFSKEAGNPSSDTPLAGQTLSRSKQYQFALSASIAFWLNNAIILAVIGFIWRLVFERRTTMKLKTALATRDAEIESTMIRAIATSMPKDHEEILKVVQEAMDFAAKHWETKTLDAVYGPKEAERLRQAMKDLQIIPK